MSDEVFVVTAEFPDGKFKNVGAHNSEDIAEQEVLALEIAIEALRRETIRWFGGNPIPNVRREDYGAAIDQWRADKIKFVSRLIKDLNIPHDLISADEFHPMKSHSIPFIEVVSVPFRQSLTT